MIAHSISTLSEFKVSYAFSVNCAINCALLKAVLNVQQFLTEMLKPPGQRPKI